MKVSERRAVAAYVHKLRESGGDPAAKLREKAGDWLHFYGQSDVYQNRAGGVVGQIIRIDVGPDWSDEQIFAVMADVGIAPDYVPATAILRDAMPHMVHLRRILLPLTNGHISRKEELLTRLGLLVYSFQSPDEPLLLGLSELREMAAKWVADLK